jgi:SAM-dependent methyltransferase
MTTAAAIPCQGALQIVRFNWPFYLFGAVALLLGAAAAILLPLPPALAAALLAGTGLAGFWLIGSIVVSHWIYDRSPLRSWQWIVPALGAPPARWINLHAGLDESTPALRRLLPQSHGRVFDFYDEREMSEPSIRRARRVGNEIAAEPVDYRRLPVTDESCDAAMLLLSAHELRGHESRLALFREVRRVLSPGGKVVLAEHLRDMPNFIAFGPGFLHFHSRRAWLAVARETGFELESQFRITPFITVFILRRPT